MARTKAEALTELGITEAEYDTQVKTYINDLRSKIPLLQSCANRRTYTELAAITHRLRNTGFHLCLDNITSICSSILNNSRNNQDQALITELVRQLLVEMNILDHEYKEAQ